MRYLVLVIFSFFIISCGSSSTSDDLSSNIPPSLNTNYSIINQLNNIRVNAGMIALSNNNYLNDSAYNHAYYLDKNNFVSHYESDKYPYFTGVTPSNRAVYAGFKSTIIGENLSVGQDSEYFSLKGLMSAIYHRFGFLDFSINTIGYGKQNLSYVYDMGNIDLNNLCYGDSFEERGRSYYINVCADATFKIETNIYDDTKDKTINANPSYVVYPYANELNVTTSFYDETPDPLPTYDVSGYPISIEFNKNKYNMDSFSINSFIIYDDNNNVLELAADYKDSNTILSKENDINNIYFNDYQFVIFPKNRLEYNTHYNVEFSYIYNGETKLIKWGFTTEKLDNMITYNNSTLNIESNKKYYLYIPPEDKNDIYNRFSTTCIYYANVDMEFFDKNTLSVNILSSNSNMCTISLSNTNETNTKTINININ
jgi:hypothetical protein